MSNQDIDDIVEFDGDNETRFVVNTNGLDEYYFYDDEDCSWHYENSDGLEWIRDSKGVVTATIKQSLNDMISQFTQSQIDAIIAALPGMERLKRVRQLS